MDDPTRFKRSTTVGAYGGLITRRYASGEIDRTGRILEMRRRDAAKLPLRGGQWAAHARSRMVGAQSLGHQACEAQRTPQSQGCRRSKVAVILHLMWIEGTEFNWSSKEVTNQPA